MKRRFALVLAVVFMFVLVAGMFYGTAVADEKAKKSCCTVQKEVKCEKKTDGACTKDKKECTKEEAAKCEQHKEQAKSACKESSCTKSCPASSACKSAEAAKK